jgi:UDP-glucose 4-epimerase
MATINIIKQTRSSGVRCGGLDTTTRVLVTGGAGFIGSSLVHTLLEKNYKVAILDNMSVGLRDNIPRNSKLRLVTGDVRDFELLSTVVPGHSHAIHLAAQAFIPLGYELPMRAHAKAG